MTGRLLAFSAQLSFRLLCSLGSLSMCTFCALGQSPVKWQGAEPATLFSGVSGSDLLAV